MKWLISTLFIVILIFVVGFREKNSDKFAGYKGVATVDIANEKDSTISNENDQHLEFVEYAKTMLGTPYLYGSTDPAKGLDCSGFINAVSNHFGMKVPRSSVEFTNFGTSVDAKNAMPGDLILFTGTDPDRHVVGHIGIITENNDGDVEFIHSSSGKAKGVTISGLEGYYESRFVKIIRIFPTGENKVIA